MALDDLDYYSILQVKSEATQEDVRAAYKRLALLNHPDRSTNPKATEIMQLINQAFEVLGSPEKRAEYDLQRIPPPKPPEPAPVDQTQPQPTTVKAAQPAPPPPPAPAPVVTPEQERQHLEWLRGQFKNILRIMTLLVLLFFLSLITGEVNLVAVLLVVAAALYTVGSIIFKIRKPLAR